MTVHSWAVFGLDAIPRSLTMVGSWRVSRQLWSARSASGYGLRPWITYKESERVEPRQNGKVCRRREPDLHVENAATNLGPPEALFSLARETRGGIGQLLVVGPEPGFPDDAPEWTALIGRQTLQRPFALLLAEVPRRGRAVGKADEGNGAGNDRLDMQRLVAAPGFARREKGEGER